MSQSKSSGLIQPVTSLRVKQLEYVTAIPLKKQKAMPIESEGEEKEAVEAPICTKLMAPPGSGKTRCAVERMRFMVLNGMVQCENLFFITFSRPACDEVSARVQQYKDYRKWIALDNITTLDAFAKSVLEAEGHKNSNNVDLLSLTLRNILRERSSEEIGQMKYVQDMGTIFFDEAQDLNEIQYNILLQLYRKRNVQINIIGDVNQNIFQFRNASDKYMFKFPGQEFVFTENMRSKKNIVEFQKCLRSYVFSDIEAPTESQSKNQVPIEIIIKPRSTIHTMIVEYLKIRQHESDDLERVAIISPTRGTGNIKDIGLSVIANLLHMNDIPFVRYYDEGGNNGDRSKKKYVSVAGHVSLLTYTGTKGLEWDTVLVMNMHMRLFNRLPRIPSEYWDQLNLIHVAVSRAERCMKIYAYDDQKIHPAMSKVPKHLYVLDPPDLDITNLTFPLDSEKKIAPITAISNIVDRLDPETLNDIYDMLTLTVRKRRVMSDWTKVDRQGDEAMFDLFVRELFSLQMHEHLELPPKKIAPIEDIRKRNFVILDDTEYAMVKSFVSRNKTLTWDQFLNIKNGNHQGEISNFVKNTILEKFRRDIEFSENSITTHEMKKIIDDNRDIILERYDRYLNCDTWSANVSDLFYLTLVVYCLDTGHYYYMSDQVDSKQHLFQNFLKLFFEMDAWIGKYLEKIGHKVAIENVPVMWEKLSGINGRIDWSFEDESQGSKTPTSLIVKTTSDLYIKQYVELLLLGFCQGVTRRRDLKIHDIDYEHLYHHSTTLFNPYLGCEYTVEIEVTPVTMFKILNLIADQCHLKFADMDLIYDLETTGLIQQDEKGDDDVYPDITQLTIRDYETYMIVYNHHVKPNKPIPKFIEELTHITNEMVKDKPSIDKTRDMLAIQLRNMLTTKMYAHNGIWFDARVMKHHDLIPATVYVNWLDTIPIMKMFYKLRYKSDLAKKGLGAVYKTLFDEEIKQQHTAIGDVNAIIRILHQLAIDF
jgi:hypothetical protein